MGPHDLEKQMNFQLILISLQLAGYRYAAFKFKCLLYDACNTIIRPANITITAHTPAISHDNHH